MQVWMVRQTVRPFMFLQNQMKPMDKNYAPILLFVYNRPAHTRNIVESLLANSLAGQSELFIFSDEAKDESSRSAVDEVRKYIRRIKGFKEIHITERNENWGLAKSIIAGVSEIIETYEKVIVLEDDLIVAPFFLKFMNDALTVYQNEPKVGHIQACDFTQAAGLPDTFLIKWTGSWGWATWKRVWNLYDYDMSYDQKELISKVGEYIKSKEAIRNFLKIIARQDELDAGKEKSYWDYQLTLSLLYNKKYTIRPVVNLVSNIGFNERATHTMLHSAQLANRPTVSILPIIHPENVCIKNHHKDNGKLETPIFKRIKRFIKRFIYRFI